MTEKEPAILSKITRIIFDEATQEPYVQAAHVMAMAPNLNCTICTERQATARSR